MAPPMSKQQTYMTHTSPKKPGNFSLSLLQCVSLDSVAFHYPEIKATEVKALKMKMLLL